MVRAKDTPVICVVMGTSGCGKSSVGLLLSQALALPFVDGDDLHPPANVDKMSHGVPLDDADRLPWLENVHRVGVARARETVERRHAKGREHDAAGSKEPPLQGPLGMIMACSALKESYRDILRGITQHMSDHSDRVRGSAFVDEASGSDTDPITLFVYLKASKEVLCQRLRARKGHFFKESMLNSQFDTLQEPPYGQEESDDIITLQVDCMSAHEASVAAEREIRSRLTW